MEYPKYVGCDLRDNELVEIHNSVNDVQKPRTLDFFKAKLDKTLTPAKAEAAFGKADRNIGSGLIIYEYDLDDGSKVSLSFPGFAAIVAARHVTKDGKTEDLPLK